VNAKKMVPSILAPTLSVCFPEAKGTKHKVTNKGKMTAFCLVRHSLCLP
jgi:hypothetical protein